MLRAVNSRCLQIVALAQRAGDYKLYKVENHAIYIRVSGHQNTTFIYLSCITSCYAEHVIQIKRNKSEIYYFIAL